jgi:UDP-glucose 4-epimerase
MNAEKIFVTGSSGFIGAAVVRQLISDGREVAILVRRTSDRQRLPEILDHVAIIEGDLSDSSTYYSALKDFRPDSVVHLAWEGVKGVDRNSSVQMINVVNSIELYKLTERIGCSQFVGLGSQAEYGRAVGRISEAAQTRPTTAYGAAKLATSLVLERSAAGSGRPFAWLRLFSSYGPNDDPSWLVPYLIRSLIAGEKPSLTKAEQIWDYIHVNDVATGIVASVNADARGFFNIGSGKAKPLRDIISIIRDAIDPSLPLGFGELPYRPDQVMHLEADITALSSATGWSPRISFESGIAQTVAWHRSIAAKVHS